MPHCAASPSGPSATRPIGPGHRVLASRFTRLVAFILDGVIACLCSLGFACLGSEAVGAAVWLVTYVYLMTEHGQTPGKALVGIQIIRGDGQPAGFIRGAIVRNAAVPVAFVGILALVVRLSPAIRDPLDEPTLRYLAAAFVTLAYLPLFGPSRRTLHDYLAGTHVVER